MTIWATKNINEADCVTHGGVFHADEVFATVILGKVMGDITVCRTFRVSEDTSAIVYDIGGGELDHHQRGGNGVRENSVPYAAAGLVWKKYGRQCINNFLMYCDDVDDVDVDLVWRLIDESLIQGIDAVDNGFVPQTGDFPATIPTLSGVISSFNPTWDSTEDNPDDAFLRACDLAETVFDNTLSGAVSKAKAKGIVEEAIINSEEGIMILERFVPWHDFLFKSQNPKAENVLFVVFPSNRGGYNWQCVPDAIDGFGQRKPVPQEWKGLRDAQLQKVSGVADAIFCHPAGFIGGAETIEGALAMAQKAIAS